MSFGIKIAARYYELRDLQSIDFEIMRNFANLFIENMGTTGFDSKVS